MQRRRGFTAVEFLVLIGIGVVLLSILGPYVLKTRESARRDICVNNLLALGHAFNAYASNNNGWYPRVVYDPSVRPTGYVAFTGPDDPNPFAPGSAVQPSDVTASLWLLIREGYISSSEYSPPGLIFICPSSDETADPARPAEGQSQILNRSNFRSGKNLSYSYYLPFSASAGYKLSPDLLSRVAILADKNPGVGNGSDVTGPAVNASPFEFTRANSRNHGNLGQHVLYADLHVEFQETPYCGRDGDNIYTALAAQPLNAPLPTVSVRGVLGTQFSPTWQNDSYLVPTEQDQNGNQFPRPPAKPTTTTVPATGPTSLPTTRP